MTEIEYSKTVIGRNYATKRSDGNGGTHASPRMHWRRGHFRQQAFGPKMSERKIIWLEPTLGDYSATKSKIWKRLLAW